MISPFRKHKEAQQSYSELRSYLEKLNNSKRVEIESEKIMKESTLLGTLKLSKCHCLETTLTYGCPHLDLFVGAGLPSNTTSRPFISPAEVLGNIFIIMFAGHEANANTLTFILILLACHPSIQRRLQHEIDRVVGSSSISSPQSWSYNAVYPLLSNSVVGAVINEGLRLFTVLPYIPKYIPDKDPQVVHMAERNHTLLPGTLILINTSALHNHPKYWPYTGPGASSEAGPNPVDAFDPDSWLCTGFANAELQQGATQLRWPQEGTFVPFSDGSRGCLGKKFALVELVGVVTRIFSEYSVELALDGIPQEQDDDTQGTKRWGKARERVKHQLSADIEFRMSLRLVGTVPLNLVKRGEETCKDI